MIEVPSHFFTVRYDGERYPGAPDTLGLAMGANCQHFAYELLRYYGKAIPDFRSSDLWDDEVWTFRVSVFEPLDLVLYHSTDQARGAHVGVFLGGDRILHLAKKIGHPAIWTHEQFVNTPRYQHFIGAKRVRDKAVVTPE